MTPAEIRTFQSDPMHVSPFGRALKADGILGPQTQWAIDFATVALGRHAAAHRAWAHYGLVETTPNDEPRGIIRSLLKAAGAQPGDPWCASYVCDCLGGFKSAGAVALGQHYPAVDFAHVLPMDLCWFRTDAKGHGHAELVLGANHSAGLVMTIGGNVDNGVRLSLRPAESVNFSRAVNDSRGTCPDILVHHPDVLLRVPSFIGTR